MTNVRVFTIRNAIEMAVSFSIAATCSTATAQSEGYPLLQNQSPPSTLEIHNLPPLPETIQQQTYLEPSSSWTSSSKSSTSLESTVSKFATQFDRAYNPINEANQNSVQSGVVSRNTPDSTKLPVKTNSEIAEPSIADLNFETEQLSLQSLPPQTLSTQPTARIAKADLNAWEPWSSSSENTVNGSFQPPGNAYPLGGNISNSSAGILAGPANQTYSNIWWKEQVLAPIHSPGSLQSVDTNDLVYRTLQNSPRIMALSQSPLIRDLQIIEADSSFDPTSFVRSQFQDRVDPVGDNLSITSDGSDFLKDHIWSGEFGIRKKNRTGMTYEVGQTLGFKNSNSSFFDPQDQGTATLALNVTQPLLRGRGRYYNESQILIAQSTGGAAWNTFAGELQDEIQKTVKAYWQLYFDRSVYLQKQRNVERGAKILLTLEGRAGLDSLPSQIARARSAVQSRKTDLANALRDIRDSETELRRLTADKDWKTNQFVEMIPTESPTTEGIQVDLENIVFSALENRPEIKEAMIRAKIAGIQKEISTNDLLPELSFLMGTYVSALKGESQLGQAIQDQFGEVTPGYSVGLEFEFPIGNRAAQSRLAQRKLQLAKIRAEVDETVQNVVAESQVSLRRVTSAKETLDAAIQAIAAANADLEQNLRRWESFALIEGDIAEGQTPTTVLDQLLDSQERLTAAELVYTQSELELKSAEVALKRTMGTLLIHENVTLGKVLNGSVPQMTIDKSN